MVKLLFFARLREDLGTSTEELPLPADVTTVASLRAHLMARGGAWASVLANGKALRVAGSAMSWFTATRRALPFASTLAHAPPRVIRCARRLATVATPSGSATSSAAVPRSSRSRAK
jgi:molybdopterin converting factor small subunit